MRVIVNKVLILFKDIFIINKIFPRIYILTKLKNEYFTISYMDYSLK